MATNAGSRSRAAIETRLEAIRQARGRLLAEMEGVTEEQGRWRPKEAEWSLQEVVEHLVLAEKGGIDSVWKAADAHRAGTPTWTGRSENTGHSIEEVIHPHFLSGPLGALQRLEFIRFHLEHHLPQVRRLTDAQGV